MTKVYRARKNSEPARLLEEYKNPETSDERADEIITRLYNLGYKVRPRDGDLCLLNRLTNQFVQK